MKPKVIYKGKVNEELDVVIRYPKTADAYFNIDGSVNGEDFVIWLINYEI